MPEKIESRLAAALGGIAAPDELWTRVNAALPVAVARRQTPAKPWPRFVMAAAMAAVMSGGVVYLRANAGRPSSHGSASSLAAVAVSAHETGMTLNETNYSVDRRSVSGQPVTLVSEPSPRSLPETRKQIRTSATGLLAVSEWTASGRRWAMVTPKGIHRQACAICHRA